MTKTIAILCTLLCWGLLAAGTASAGAINRPNNCQFLNVVATSSAIATVPMPNGVTCNHGYFISSTPAVGTTLTTQVQQSSVEGPDCNIVYTSAGQTFEIHVQQNYCSLEAGNITAQVVTGSVTIGTITQGSWGGNESGTINVTLNTGSSTN